MKLRYYAAIVTGVMALTTTTLGLWTFTQVRLGGIMFAALTAYYFGVAAVLLATEPRKKPKRRKLPDAKEWAREQRLVYVTLDREQWKSDKSA